MIKYSYQLLRYQPDRVSGEFLNVGIVLLDNELSFLRAEALDKIGRVKFLFPSVNSRAFISKVKNLTDAINHKGFKWNEGLGLKERESIQDITSSVLPNDDSSLYFSEVKVGIDINAEIAFRDLFKRFVLSNELYKENYLSDKDVWSEYYKSHFASYKDKFESKSIVTKGDKLNFDHAIKNGTWNYLEPVTFDLSRESNVKDKVYKWMGKLDELDSSSEIFKLFLLVKMPTNNKLKKFIKDRIENNSADNFEVKLIEPHHAEEFSVSLLDSVNHS